MGFKAWYDNRASDLTKEGMLKGIEQAAAFILFLSQGVLERPYCQMEIRHAVALKKPIVLLHESDARYGSFDFRAAHEGSPTDLQELLDNNESLPFRRRGYGECVLSGCICPQTIYRVIGSTFRARWHAADSD